MGHVVTFKTLIKTTFIPWKCLTMKRVQLPLLPQVTEVSKSKYLGVFCFAGTLFLITLHNTVGVAAVLLFSFSSASPGAALLRAQTLHPHGGKRWCSCLLIS